MLILPSEPKLVRNTLGNTLGNTLSLGTIRPLPGPDILWVNTILVGPIPRPNLGLIQLLPRHRTLVLEVRQTIDSVHRETVSVSLVTDSELERSVDVTLLLVTSNVDVMGTWALVSESVDEPGVRVEVEDDGSVLREVRDPMTVSKTVTNEEGQYMFKHRSS